jgi:methyltransferase (TIGR00027 family)
MDARAFRLDLPPELAWFELDKPELVALKNEVLSEIRAKPKCAYHPIGLDVTADWGHRLMDAGFVPAKPSLWLLEGLLMYLEPNDVGQLLDEITELSAPGSEVLTDSIGQSALDNPDMQPILDRLAEQGSPWRFGTDEPEADLFEPRGWRAKVSLYSEIGGPLGRWPYPAFPRSAPGR